MKRQLFGRGSSGFMAATGATFFEPLEPRTLLSAVFTVTTTDDAGDGSLRQAVIEANAFINGDDEPDRIEFAIGGQGVQIISLQSPLPDLIQPVIIDGYTQEGSSENTQAGSSDAALRIVLDGSGAGGGSGLTLAAGSDGSTVRGLVIQGFAGAGITIFESNDNVIEGNFIGTNAAGTQAAPNDGGIEVSGGSRNLIGGSAPAARNIISGNGDAGIVVFNSLAGSSDENLIVGNFIGVDATGAGRLGNDGDGIDIFGLASDNVIGGAGAGEGNVIAANDGDGIEVFGNSVQLVHRNAIVGNFIGTNAAGAAGLGNTGDGIEVFSDGTEGVVVDTLIEGNLIAHNEDGDGIELFGNTQGTTISSNTIRDNQGTGVLVDSGELGVRMTANAIFDNRDMPIDLDQDGPTPNDAGDEDEGANRLQNFPELSDPALDGATGSVQVVLNSTPDTEFVIEIFVSDALDPSGNGQAQVFAASQTRTTDGTGVLALSFEGFNVGPGQFVTATATDPDGNTSEVSPAVQMPGEQSAGFEFGKDSAFGKNKRVFIDADGTRVIFQLNGRGVGTVIPVGGDAEGNGATAYALEFAGTEAGSKAAVKVKGGDDGEAFLSGVAADGSLKSFIARNVNLNGDMTIAGTLLRLLVDDASEGGDEQITIDIQGAGAAGNEKLNATFDALGDVTIVSQIPIKKITADDWIDRDGGAVRDSLTAPSLDAMKVRGDRRDGERGDLDADITLTDGAAVLKKLLVNGLIDGATIRSAGDVGEVRAGAIRGSTVFAGVADDATAGALPAAGQLGERRIGTFKITGKVRDDLGGSAFIDSNVAASAIDNIDLTGVDGGGEDDFGLATLAARKYRRDALKLKAADLQTPGELDRLGNFVFVLLEV